MLAHNCDRSYSGGMDRRIVAQARLRKKQETLSVK
jgi:hypothetical protein